MNWIVIDGWILHDFNQVEIIKEKHRERIRIIMNHPVTACPRASSRPGWQNRWNCLTFAICKHTLAPNAIGTKCMKFQVISLKFPPLEWHVPSHPQSPSHQAVWCAPFMELSASKPPSQRFNTGLQASSKKNCKPAIFGDRKVHPPPPIPKKNQFLKDWRKQTW